LTPKNVTVFHSELLLDKGGGGSPDEARFEQTPPIPTPLI